MYVDPFPHFDQVVCSPIRVSPWCSSSLLLWRVLSLSCKILGQPLQAREVDRPKVLPVFSNYPILQMGCKCNHIITSKRHSIYIRPSATRALSDINGSRCLGLSQQICTIATNGLRARTPASKNGPRTPDTGISTPDTGISRMQHNTRHNAR